MSRPTRIWMLACTAFLASVLLAVPAMALTDDAAPALAVEESDVEGSDAGAEEDGRIQLAETPRDRLALVLLAALLVGGGLAAANGRRQLKGERPQASGEFRWR
ncbi:MAG: hypothetical protein WD638_07870 [Nitriliruptoraceae bacterium]